MTYRTPRERMIRVDQAGEFGATRIYEGQLAVMGNRGPHSGEIAAMARQEEGHRARFDALMAERGVRPTILQPFWSIAGYGLGVATALIGPEAAMACTAAVEEEIDRHYSEQLDELEADGDDPDLAAMIEEFREDEREHRDAALAAGAERAPAYPLLAGAIRLGCRAAIKLAREGFQINPRMHDALGRSRLTGGHSEMAKALFYGADGEPLPVGTLVRNEALAKSFETFAAGGAQAFYTGENALALATTVAADTPKPGAMTYDDIAGYEAKERGAVCSSYREYRICSMGPPTSGGVAVQQILGQLERFDLAALGMDNPVTWHLFVESQRLAYADRELYLADSDYVTVPVAGLLEKNYLAERSALISADKSMTEVTAGRPRGAPMALADGDEPVEHGTSHLAVVDGQGTMVSYTSTIESAFGSGLMVGGYYLNNELTDFSRSPEVDGRMVANRVEAGKRPRSSMSPTVVYDPQERPFFVVGAAGGSTIPVTTARAIVGAIDFGLSAEESLRLPFLMAFGDSVLLEEGTWLEAQAGQFRALGHEELIIRQAPIKGGALRRVGDQWETARDPRLEGYVDMP